MDPSTSMTDIFLLIQAVLVVVMYCLWSLCWKHKQIVNLDKALVVTVYIGVALCVYPILLYSSQQNAFSHIHINENIYSVKECHDIVNAAKVEAEHRNGWTTRRHSSYPTTDVSVYSMNASLTPFVEWLNTTVEERVFPLLAQNFDISSSSFVMRDLFIVKYDELGQSNLREHRDNCKLSFNVALSSHGRDFHGGGTSFTLINHTINILKGSLLSHDSGVYHAGNRVISGTRYILIGFVQLQHEYWWRTFGTYASCMSYPSGMSEEITDFKERKKEVGGRNTVCRSLFWIARHQCWRTLDSIMSLLAGTDESTIGVDYSMKIVILLLLVLLVLLLIILAYICVRGDSLSAISSMDVAVMKWFSLLSEEELAFLEIEDQVHRKTSCDIENSMEGIHKDGTNSSSALRKNLGRYNRNISSCFSPLQNDIRKKD